MMNYDEFKKLIESIGFKSNVFHIYQKDYNGVKSYSINLYNDCYHFFYGSEWIIDIPLNNLTPIEKYFKRELRSIKLKGLLG